MEGREFLYKLCFLCIGCPGKNKPVFLVSQSAPINGAEKIRMKKNVEIMASPIGVAMKKKCGNYGLPHRPPEI